MNRNSMDFFAKFMKIKSEIFKEEKVYSDDIDEKKMIAIMALNNLVLSKKIFKKNKLVGEFLKENFSLNFSKSMLASRTILCGKIFRIIMDMEDEEDLDMMLNRIYGTLIKIEEGKEITKDIYDVIEDMEL